MLNELKGRGKDSIKQLKESRNELLEQWSRFVTASRGENDFMNARLNWLLVSQAGLFAVLSLFVGKDIIATCVAPPESNTTLCADYELARPIIAFMGLFISMLVTFGLIAAGRMHWVWTKRLRQLACEMEDLTDKIEKKRLSAEPHNVVPFVPFGTGPWWPARTTSWVAPSISAAFTLIWLFLFLFWGNSRGLTLFLGSIALAFAVFLYFRTKYPIPRQSTRKGA